VFSVIHSTTALILLTPAEELSSFWMRNLPLISAVFLIVGHFNQTFLANN